MTETFVPLPRPVASARENGFTPLPLKLFSQSQPQPVHSNSCREPVVTLQREGEKITSVHIECPCGQVIDLLCEY